MVHWFNSPLVHCDEGVLSQPKVLHPDLFMKDYSGSMVSRETVEPMLAWKIC